MFATFGDPSGGKAKSAKTSLRLIPLRSTAPFLSTWTTKLRSTSTSKTRNVNLRAEAFPCPKRILASGRECSTRGPNRLKSNRASPALEHSVPGGQRPSIRNHIGRCLRHFQSVSKSVKVLCCNEVDRFDPEVLLDLLKEQVHGPATISDFCDLKSRKRRAISEKHKTLHRLQIPATHRAGSPLLR